MALTPEDPDYVPPNDTAAALLRKLEDGTFMNHAGAKVQAFLAEMRFVASRKGNGRSNGEINIKIKMSMGKDGYALPVASISCKTPQVARAESMIFVDAEGDLMARPVEKQLALKGIEGGAADAPKPVVQAVSSL